jgi:hypothetical protein
MTIETMWGQPSRYEGQTRDPPGATHLLAGGMAMGRKSRFASKSLQHAFDR